MISALITPGTLPKSSKSSSRGMVTSMVSAVMVKIALPPVGTMEGVGIATEGILTLSRVLSALEEMRSPGREPAAVKAILERVMRHDRIEFVIGTKVNESHQDPGIPQDLELRRSVIRRMAQALERNYRKKVTVNYY